MEQIIEVKLDIPDGFEFVRWGEPMKGDWLLSSASPQEVNVDRLHFKDLIFKKTTPPWQPQVGDAVEWKLGDDWYPGKVIDQTEGGDWLIYDKDDRELYEVDQSEVRPPRAKQWKLVGPEDVGQKVFNGSYASPRNGGYDWAEDPELLRWTLAGFSSNGDALLTSDDWGNRTVPASQIYIFK